MFTQAGVREDFRPICEGLVSRRSGARGAVDAVLVRFPCGDLAWLSRTQACWIDQVVIHSIKPSARLDELTDEERGELHVAEVLGLCVRHR